MARKKKRKPVSFYQLDYRETHGVRCPEKVSNTRIWKFAWQRRKDGTNPQGRCWFTGAPCLFAEQDEQGRIRVNKTTDHRVYCLATREHLIALVRGGSKGNYDNLVLAMNFINVLVKDAPLSLKVKVRNELHEPNRGPLSLDDIRDLQSRAQKILNSFDVDGILQSFPFPYWRDGNLRGSQHPDMKFWDVRNPFHEITPEILRRRNILYDRLLDEEEKIVKEFEEYGHYNSPSLRNRANHSDQEECVHHN